MRVERHGASPISDSRGVPCPGDSTLPCSTRPGRHREHRAGIARYALPQRWQRSAGFDCSGFTQYVFGRSGVVLPRDVREQFRLGKSIKSQSIGPGDLLFFSTVARGASHVGIAISRSQFVHAPTSKGVVRVEQLTQAYWARRFIGARRLG